ncbi:hypothetical protein PBY51_014902 [Eleginops maclovinus]|nr:hypothetical protein PBY51_014902 [Eleginops maclovinus]
MPCILKPTTHGGSRTVLLGTKATFDWEACNELEAGAEQRPREYLMTKRLRTNSTVHDCVINECSVITDRPSPNAVRSSPPLLLLCYHVQLPRFI